MLPTLLTPPSSGIVPWNDLQVFDWVRALEACPQDPIHHAEGNVWIHTRMVLETLLEMPGYQALSEIDKSAVYLGCLLHDVAKPATTRIEEDGRVTAKGHSRAGELLARRLLWEMDVPVELREQVCGLIKFHQIPFFLINSPKAQRTAAELSLFCRADLLAMVAEADIRGRICNSLPEVLENIELFRAFCQDEGCYQQPRAFASDHTRYLFFHSDGRHPDVEAFDDTKGEMILMCGLPGAGKDTYIRRHYPDLPVISLDDLRIELDVEATDNQGTVLQMSRQRLREQLRSGKSFVFNATNLHRQRRQPILDLAADYKVRTRIVYVEAPRKQLLASNRGREAQVPEDVIFRMTKRWEMPSLLEAHQVDRVLR